MPLYSIQCPVCGDKDDIFRAVVDRDNLPTCQCGTGYKRVLTAPFVKPDIEAYISPSSGRLISSRTQRREDMKEGGYIDYEPGMMKDIERNRKRVQEEAFKPIAETVDSIVTEMNVTGKLENLNA